MSGASSSIAPCSYDQLAEDGFFRVEAAGLVALRRARLHSRLLVPRQRRRSPFLAAEPALGERIAYLALVSFGLSARPQDSTVSLHKRRHHAKIVTSWGAGA